MNRDDFRLAIGSLLAIAVPAAFLHTTTEATRTAAGLSVAPFGWPRLLVAHLAFALPLGYLAASRLRQWPPLRDAVPGVWVAVGLGVAGLAVVVLPGFGEAVVDAELGPVAALLLRSMIAFGLVLPWCLAVARTEPGLSPGLAFALGTGLAVVPCGMYSQVVITARTATVQDLLERERLGQARPLVLALCELGSDEPISKRAPRQVLKNLDAVMPKLEAAVKSPLPQSAPPAARLERTMALVRLGRLEEAAAVVSPLATSDPNAGLLLAGIYRDLERWTDSDALFWAAVDHFTPLAASDPVAADLCRVAYEGLVFNARNSGRPTEAERILSRGLETLPGLAADFHYQLARHHADGGRPRQAARHLEEAVRLDPARYTEPAEQLHRSLLTGPYGCTLPGR